MCGEMAELLDELTLSTDLVSGNKAFLCVECEENTHHVKCTECTGVNDADLCMTCLMRNV